MSAVSGEVRREQILEILREASDPISGSVLADRCKVSRQVIVTDVALLRSRGAQIVSTSRGYVLLADKNDRPTRLFKCRHTAQQAADELTCIVDLGARVEDVFVNHRVYGKISSCLHVCSRRDVERFVNEIAAGSSSPLLEVTNGYHFHHVSAESEEILDEVARVLDQRGYLAKLSDYEISTFA